VREDVRWTYAVHEQILPALRRVNVPVRWTEVTVRHTGYTDPALRERKLQRDCKILEAELAERPDDPFVLFNLGTIAVERQAWSTALGHLQRSLLGSAPTDSSGEWRERTDRLCSVDQGIYGHLTLRKLAVLAEERGDRAEARRLRRMVLDACPGDAEATSRGEASQ
jgi:hypothetical protein